MPAARTQPLSRELVRAMPDRPFSLRFWDGGEVPATRPGPTIEVRSPGAVADVLRAPGELGLGRAYVRGELEIDDLDGVVALLGRWQPPPIGFATRLRILLAAVRAAGLRRPQPPAAELLPRGAPHSKGRDRAAVRHHYDVANEFFALFLDPTMTYSCALFETGEETLEEAQRAKLDLVCGKLGLEPGMRMLDIGCGWGSLVIHAAREYGVSALGITLSEPQAAWARERIHGAGLDGRAEVRVVDYRDLADERFDAIASIGMVEHVGESRIDEYAEVIARLLAAEGRALNHGIAQVNPEPLGAHRSGAFSSRYVFPDAQVLNLSRMIVAFERAGFEALHVENLHTDYAETLRHWLSRLDERLDEAERLAGPERVRVWRLYLRAARNGFETGQNAVYQILCSRPLTEPAAPRPRSRGVLGRRRAPLPVP